MRRIIVVYNSRSSHFERVKAEVLDKLYYFKGVLVGKYEVLATDVDDNAVKLAQILTKGDLVLAVGGDATASIAANGILRFLETGLSETEKPILAVLPYGNFCDLARTLGTKRLEDIFGSSGEFNVDGLKTEEFWPLEIMVDEKHFRYAMCYATIGMMAEATELFDAPEVRTRLRQGKKTPWKSYFYLAKWYFKNRKKRFLPEYFKMNEVQKKCKTDYIATNGKTMAKVMRTQASFKTPDFFRSNAFRLDFFGSLMGFMARSILFFTPVKKTTQDILEFEKPTSLEIQAEGEYKKCVQVKKVMIKKSVQSIRVVTRK